MTETFEQFNATTGNLKEVTPIVTSAGAGDGGKLAATDSTGRFDVSLMPVGIAPEVVSFVASEDIGAGNWVNLWLSAGVQKGRLADCSNGRRADVFVLAAVTTGNTGTGFGPSNRNTALSGLTIDSAYFLSTAGGQSTSPPGAGSGVISQQLGKATATSEILFEQFPIYERG